MDKVEIANELNDILRILGRKKSEIYDVVWEKYDVSLSWLEDGTGLINDKCDCPICKSKHTQAKKCTEYNYYDKFFCQQCGHMFEFIEMLNDNCDKARIKHITLVEVFKK